MKDVSRVLCIFSDSLVTMKIVRLLVSLVIPLQLAACIAPLVIGGIAVPAYISSPAIETAYQFNDSSSQSSLKAKAESGDRIAQYRLGDSFCCHVGGPLDRISVYDNKEATNWYCKSAHQRACPLHHADAVDRMARIKFRQPHLDRKSVV